MPLMGMHTGDAPRQGLERVPVRNDESPRSATVRLRPDPASAGAARRFVASTLVEWRWRGSLDEVVLLTSELVANGVGHAASPLVLTLIRDGECVRVELSDSSAAHPVLRAVPPDAERGRGLALVEALSRRWGFERVPADGKVVWFEISA